MMTTKLKIQIKLIEIKDEKLLQPIEDSQGQLSKRFENEYSTGNEFLSRK
jgi:hypothetical protein